MTGHKYLKNNVVHLQECSVETSSLAPSRRLSGEDPGQPEQPQGGAGALARAEPPGSVSGRHFVQSPPVVQWDKVGTMNRRHFLALTPAAWALVAPEAPRDPIPEPHFPSRLHLFVWRNWELAPTARMARLLRTTGRNVLDLGYSMGLPGKHDLSPDLERRIYITVIRQNWHVLPQSQIVELLGWDESRFSYVLKEDDFLGIKLGPKPVCAELHYAVPSKQEREAAARVRRIVRETLGPILHEKGENLFDFVAQLSATSSRAGRTSTKLEQRAAVWNPRYLYSYFALYGDPLTEPGIDPFPDGYLEKLSHHGINGVWMQAVLNKLAPSTQFPEFGDGSEVRLANLQKLVERAASFGVRIYLYLNEPRAMPAAFFDQYPDVRGTSAGSGFYAMCTSTPPVREWIAGALAHILHKVPDLGGFFTITMSENQTNCFSHGGAWGTGAPKSGDCPHCSERQSWDTIGELIQTFRDGIRKSSPSAELISWDWGWGDTLARNLIPLLPKDTSFMSISEWEQPVHRGGIDTRVGEYSISVTGPGPRARRNWQLAADNGIRALAKVQLNNTWEISAVPYIPVLDLVAEHCENLSRAGVQGLMASWTCGGYPSPNLAVAQAYYFEERPPRDRILLELAAQRYGESAAPEIRAAWRQFSQAFRQFPYGVAVYTIPTQHGPANPLRFHPTKARAGMILFPYDDLKTWCGAYPPEVVLDQFTKLAAEWKEGLEKFRAGVAKAALYAKATAIADLATAETCYHHFQSVANQVEFYILRSSPDSAALARMRAIARQEIGLARRQYRCARRNSTIAYEASNHYYYTPLDLLEKILNCRYLIDHEIPAADA